MAQDESTPCTLEHKYDYRTQFDPQAYLDHFFSESATNNGLRLSLFAIPRFIKRMPDNFKCDKLLDIGSGPTIYMAACFRDVANKVYLTDYTESSRELLQQWLDSTGAKKHKVPAKFDWMPMARALSMSEGGDYDQCGKMLEETRSRISAVWHCDVHDANVVCDRTCDFDTRHAFDIVTSIFCLESACANLDDYKRCMAHCCSRLKPGGYYFLGSVLEDTTYEYGSDRFDLLYLTRADIDAALAAAGMDVHGAQCMEHDGAVMIMCNKL